MMSQKIAPNLWFDGNAAEAVDFYVSVFPNSKVNATSHYPHEGLAELLPQLNQSLVYLSGPEPMVETLGEELKKQGLPIEQLKQDFFPNYDEKNY